MMKNNKELLIKYTEYLKSIKCFSDVYETYYTTNEIVDGYLETTNKINSKYLSENLIQTIIYLNKKYNERIIFCGSFGLVVNGLLDREIHDIDCFTLDNHYGCMPINMDEHDFGSGHFFVGGKEIFNFCEKINNYSIDIMYREDPDNIKYNIVDFYGSTIKIEDPEFAIKAKKQYLESNKNLVNKEKHLSDLRYLGIPFTYKENNEDDNLSF
jgi:hypothetical protein